jgi:hypothetical protein
MATNSQVLSETDQAIVRALVAALVREIREEEKQKQDAA